VRVELAGHMDLARHVAGVVEVVDLLVLLQHDAEGDDLEQRRHEQRVPVRHADSHRLAEEALVDQQPAADVLAQQVEFAGLVGRQRNRDPLRAEKVRQSRRHGIDDGRFLGLGLFFGRGEPGIWLRLLFITRGRCGRGDRFRHETPPVRFRGKSAFAATTGLAPRRPESTCCPRATHF